MIDNSFVEKKGLVFCLDAGVKRLLRDCDYTGAHVFWVNVFTAELVENQSCVIRWTINECNLIWLLLNLICNSITIFHTRASISASILSEIAWENVIYVWKWIIVTWNSSQLFHIFSHNTCFCYYPPVRIIDVSEIRYIHCFCVWTFRVQVFIFTVGVEWTRRIYIIFVVSLYNNKQNIGTNQ